MRGEAAGEEEEPVGQSKTLLEFIVAVTTQEDTSMSTLQLKLTGSEGNREMLNQVLQFLRNELKHNSNSGEMKAGS